jgi:Domain of unknown function (DUF1918)
MKANVGDRLVVRGYQIREADRSGEIIEIHGDEGAPPYLVRWGDGHQSVFFPTSDAIVEHHPAQPASEAGT